MEESRPEGEAAVGRPEGAPPRARWTVLWVTTFQQVALTFVRLGLPALAPFFRPDLGLSLTETGLLLGIFDLGAMLTFYATGLLTRRLGERPVLAMGAFVTGGVSALAAASDGLLSMAPLLALAGMGFPSSHVAGSQAVVDWFPRQERGLAMGVRQAGLPIGGFLAAAVLPTLAAAWGWRTALATAGGLCAAAGLVVLATLPRNDAPSPPAAAAGWALPRRRVALAAVAGCCLIFAQFCLVGYLPLFLVDQFGWGRERAARMLLLVNLGGTAGRMGWGWLSDRAFGGSRSLPLLVVTTAGAAVLLGLSALDAAPAASALGVAALALVAGLTLLGWNALLNTFVAEMAGPSTAPVLGVMLTSLYLSSTAAPPLFGQAVEALGSYGPAWALVAALQAVALVALVRAGRGWTGPGADAAPAGRRA
ncbi:MAG TPA: MFS transporter [Dehalococcoidia bacterium]|nr:MFS transporter [Dehalococcoidia bacterium]